MTINKQNYSDFLLDYLDNELSEEEHIQFLAFMEEHDDIKEEFLLLQKTKLSADEEIVFPSKNSLYRSESKPFRNKWWLWAAAAVAAGLFFFTQYHRHSLINHNHKTKFTQTTPPRPFSEKPHKEKRPNGATKNLTSAPRVADNHTASQPIVKGKGKQAATTSASTRKHKKGIAISAPSYLKKKITPIESPLTDTKPAKQSFYPKLKKPRSLAANENRPSKKPKNRSIYHPSLSKGNKWKIKIAQEGDTTITDKIYALQEKITHPIKALNIKQVKIGKFSLQFN